jgi:hypothetical protein
VTDTGTQAVLLVDQGEDYVVQLFITDDYGNLVTLTGAAGMVCRDANGQTLFAANGGSDPTAGAALTVLPTGFIQLSIPSATTGTWAPGAYSWDMAAEAVDNSVFATRLIKVAAGVLTVNAMLTKSSDVLAALS